MMTKYDFDTVIDRRGTCATKLDGLDAMFGRHDVTPLWIADLDFAVCPDITAALRRRFVKKTCTLAWGVLIIFIYLPKSLPNTL